MAPPQLLSLLLLLLPAAAAAAVSEHAAIGIVASTSPGVAVAIGSVEKSASNPLFDQSEPWESGARGSINNGYPNVIHTPGDSLGAYRLWYGICANGCNSQLVGYANSSDGVRWEKPALGIYSDWKTIGRADLNGSANNIVMRGGGIGVFRDEHEKDPAKKFKAFGGGDSPQSLVGACFGPGGSTGCIGGGTGTSADGLVWGDAKRIKWPAPQRYDCHNNVFFDSQRGDYVATTRDGFSGPVGRTIAIQRSVPGGAFSWDAAKAPAMVEHGTKTSQLYSQITYPWKDIYLGIVMVFDATPKGHSGYDGSKVHCRLSWSKDAASWQWVDPGGLTGADFVPLGNGPEVLPGKPGEQNDFDSHICFASKPVSIQGEGERIYYMGGNGPHNGIRNSSFALATLREDGFAGLRGSGDATTTLLNATGSKLTITADILSPGGSVTVAIAEAGTPHTVSPVTANVTKHVALSGLKIGSRVAVKMTLKDAMVYTLGFTD